MKSILSIAFIATLILFGAGAALGQTHRGSVRGTVYDPNRAVVVGATITLTGQETSETRTTTSGDEGGYAFSSLRPGRYRLTVSATNFATFSPEITLLVNQELRVDAELQPQGMSDPYVLVSARDDVKRETASQGTVIENRQIQGLPLDGRNFFELALLVPGAVPPAQGSAGSVRGDFAFSVNGAREDSNNFLLDGVYNVDPKLNTFGVRPPVDAIREFENLTSTYDASFGRSAGAQVNVVLKSGSNDLHGSIFEFHRNGALDARNLFVPANEPSPKYIRNQFGFSIGGPIRKDKTFFFADYEGTRSREGITRVTNVPTLAERTGDFSQSLFGVPIIPGTGVPFPGGSIPGAAINPIGRNIAALYPLPNRPDPFANFVSSPIQQDRNDHFDVRIDHLLNSRSSWAFRYSFGDRDLFEPFAGPGLSLVPGYGNDVTRRSQNAMISETHVFSPALVNDLRFAFNRVASAVRQENQGTSVNQAVGMPELSSNPRDFGLSFITITGFSPLGHEGNNPQNSVTNTFQILDSATYARGSHLWKFGGDIRLVQQNAFRDVQSRGLLQFSPFGQITFNALGDLLLGLPLVTGGARVDNAQHLRSNSYNLFVNDSVRVTRNLTLIGGLRYEYNTPPVDAFDRATIFDPATGGLVPVGTAGVPRSGFHSDKNNFAPRVGFAWTIGDEGNTVVRGGYGVYYDQSALAPGEALYFNAPYFDFNLFFQIPGLPLTVNNPFPAFFPFALPDSALAIQRDLRTAYMQHWSGSVQQQIGRSRVLEVSYVGSKGTKLLSARDINQPQPSALPPGLPFVPRPNPFFDDITQIESRANSRYDSLQARFQQRLDFGLALLGSYTWSKSEDDASNFFSSAGDPNFPQDSYNLRPERGPSNFDTRHRFVLSYSYDLPFGKGKRYLTDDGWVSKLLSGWQTLGIVTLQSGRPFTVALLPEIDNSGTGRSVLGFGANDRPNVSGDPNLSSPSADRWFNTAAFAFPAPGTFGNAGRNILRGPGYQNVNASLVKNTLLTERLNLQFRAEAFNLFNHPNLNLPDNFLGSPTFGRITSARDPRHLQFGVKLLF
ncbi:MAG TPA: carboxypeptidase regulatory-like domain-containing protein [Pyrinomonadaceae bacterium]|nr:carboxypeptidase regulatory-like domain-containing protein [Pyrinomonadaceae bacterium]